MGLTLTGLVEKHIDKVVDSIDQFEIVRAKIAWIQECDCNEYRRYRKNQIIAPRGGGFKWKFSFAQMSYWIKT